MPPDAREVTINTAQVGRSIPFSIKCDTPPAALIRAP